MSQPASHIRETREAIGDLTGSFEKVVAKLGEYAALGGADAVRAFWQDANPDGTPKVDEDGNPVFRNLDITHQQYVDALASIQAFRDLANAGHATNLYKVKV